VITLWDFIEEDRVRRLPAGERAMHAVMGIVYGAFLANLVPEIVRWSAGPIRIRTELITAFRPGCSRAWRRACSSRACAI
jgi:hypothetical protein